jgi:branched-chain amino acid transport system permease protein
MRIMNISHGEFLMLGAYLTWLAHTVLKVNPLVFLPVVALVLFLLGLGVYRLCFRRIARTAPSVDAIEARSLLVSFGLMFLSCRTPRLTPSVRPARLLVLGRAGRDRRTGSPPTGCGVRLAVGASLVLLAILRYTRRQGGAR